MLSEQDPKVRNDMSPFLHVDLGTWQKETTSGFDFGEMVSHFIPWVRIVAVDVLSPEAVCR